MPSRGRNVTSSQKQNNYTLILDAVIFRWMVERLGEEVLLIHASGRIAYANKVAQKGLGYSQKDIVGLPITRFFDQRISLARWRKEHFLPLKRSRQPKTFVLKRIGAGGRKQTIEVTASFFSPISDEYILSVGKDITRQVQLQRELELSAERYRLLSEEAADALAVTDLNGRISFSNRRLGVLLNLSREALLGARIQDFFEAELKRRWKSLIEEIKKEKRPVVHALHLVTSRGKVMDAEAVFNPSVEKGEVKNLHIVFRDVSPHLTVASMAVKAQQAQTIQSLISGAAQELKHPLQAVSHLTDSLLKQYRDREYEYIGFREFCHIMDGLQRINDQVKYCYATVDRLIQLNKRRARMKKVCCDPREVIEQIILQREDDLDLAGIRIRKKFSPATPYVVMDHVELSQVISNLVNNAQQAMPGGGVMTFRTKPIERGRGVVVEIVDEGVGIAPENLRKVYDPFFTTKPRGVEKSSGLGLAIVHSLMTAAKGTISITSSRRKGTTVRLVLPAAKGDKKRIAS